MNARADSSLVIALPSKGRLQENAQAFFARAGLDVRQAGGSREYAGQVAGVPGVRVVFQSAAEIAASLEAGAVHFGVTGLDLLGENVRGFEDKTELVAPLGFGFADVVTAVPISWIDVRTMADLDDVALAFHRSRGRRIRVATKYEHLTREFFSRHGVTDYRIVESQGATEGAPASGLAELIVDITTTGSTLSANRLKILDDGVILKSQAHLVASLDADWTRQARQAAAHVLDQIAAEQAAREQYLLRFVMLEGIVSPDIYDRLNKRYGFEVDMSLEQARKLPEISGRCPSANVRAVADALRKAGAVRVVASREDYIFGDSNPLYEALQARLKERGRGRGRQRPVKS